MNCHPRWPPRPAARSGIARSVLPPISRRLRERAPVMHWDARCALLLPAGARKQAWLCPPEELEKFEKAEKFGPALKRQTLWFPGPGAAEPISRYRRRSWIGPPGWVSLPNCQPPAFRWSENLLWPVRNCG